MLCVFHRFSFACERTHKLFVYISFLPECDAVVNSNCFCRPHSWPSSKPDSICRLAQALCDTEMGPTSQCWISRRCHQISGSILGQGEELLQWGDCRWIYHYHCHHKRLRAQTTDWDHFWSEGLHLWWCQSRVEDCDNICRYVDICFLLYTSHTRP